MTQPSTGGATRATAAPPQPQEPSTGQLISDLTTQISRLVRDEARLAQVEVTQKAKRLGVGAGLFGGAGVVGLLAGGAFTAFLIALLSEWMDTWVAALIVTVVYAAVAAVLALRGKKEFEQATPAVPEQTVETLKEDVEWAKTRTPSGTR